MKLIAGLGNPDDKYQYSRHNIGYIVVEKLAKQLLPVERSEKGWEGNKKFTAEICKINQNYFIQNLFPLAPWVLPCFVEPFHFEFFFVLQVIQKDTLVS